MRSASASSIVVRSTQEEDFPQIIDITKAVYSDTSAWSEKQLHSHLKLFPEGQFVAVEVESQKVVGMASSLIIFWDDYEISGSWRDFTDAGFFTNHDAERGRTLYGAEVFVHPSCQGHGIGKKLYQARRELVERLGLLRIRAGGRLRGYHRHAPEISAKDYVLKVVKGELADPTLTFQLHQGFEVLDVVHGYLRHDPESLGYAAIIEWLNPHIARPEDFAGRPATFLNLK